jgi:hypothetical protein
MITIDHLSKRVKVDVVAGTVTWTDPTKYHPDLKNKDAGSIRSGGKCYWVVKIDRKAIKRSHIVFLFATGRIPSHQIDHINGNSLDDRIENLREATHQQNSWNHKGRKKRSDTPMGVRRLHYGKYQSRIRCNGVTQCLGVFDTQEEASLAYQQKRKELFGEFA